MNFLSAYMDGFAKKIAEAFDLAALHGLEPKSMTDATFRATNSFDGVINGSIVTYDETKIDENLESTVQQVTARGCEVNGIALSPAAGQALAKVKVNGVVQYPEFRFGQNPDSFYGMKSDINKNLTVTGGTAETDHAIVGDFQNRFKWGTLKIFRWKSLNTGIQMVQAVTLKPTMKSVCVRKPLSAGVFLMKMPLRV